jgi:hypothetical protein
MGTKTGNDDWKVRNYLAEWSEISHKFDIATGYFEIGALLALDGKWQKLDQIRILMGDEVTKRTRRALSNGRARAGQFAEKAASATKKRVAHAFPTGALNEQT